MAEKGRRAQQTHGLRSKIYVPVITRIFKKLYKPKLAQDSIEFSLDDIRAALDDLGLKGRNPADVVYRMRSRTVLPQTILGTGFNILRSTSRGRYCFEKAPDTIFTLPDAHVQDALDLTPLPVRRLLPENLAEIDEQGLLSVVTYCKLLDHFTGLQVFRLRSHVRKSVARVGQAEVDEVDVGVALRPDEIPVVIPIEAKAVDEPVNRVQIVYQILYALEYFPHHEIRPICIKLDDDAILHFLEFNVAESPKDLAIIRSGSYRLSLSDAQRGAIRSQQDIAQRHVMKSEPPEDPE